MIFYDGNFCVGASSCGAIKANMQQTVYRIAAAISFPVGLIAYLFKWYDQVNDEEMLVSFMPDEYVYGSVTSIVGFLLIFRTGQAYNRFTEGATLVHIMSADFLESTSLCMALSRASKATKEHMDIFHRTLVREVSALNGLCLASLSRISASDLNMFFNDCVLDFHGLDEVTARNLRHCACKPEFMLHRIQASIADELRDGGVFQSVPAPLLTRVFQELGGGMIKYSEAMKLVNVPSPFPYAVVTELLLVLHCLYTAPMMAMFCKGPMGAGMFAFAFSFFLWTLYGVAAELDNPFGEDINDLDLHFLQEGINVRLMSGLLHNDLPGVGLSAHAVDEFRLLGDIVHTDPAEGGDMSIQFHGWDDDMKEATAGRRISSRLKETKANSAYLETAACSTSHRHLAPSKLKGLAASATHGLLSNFGGSHSPTRSSSSLLGGGSHTINLTGSAGMARFRDGCGHMATMMSHGRDKSKDAVIREEDGPQSLEHLEHLQEQIYGLQQKHDPGLYDRQIHEQKVSGPVDEKTVSNGMTNGHGAQVAETRQQSYSSDSKPELFDEHVLPPQGAVGAARFVVEAPTSGQPDPDAFGLEPRVASRPSPQTRGAVEVLKQEVFERNKC